MKAIWLTTGDGTPGATMACGSGAAPADLLSGIGPGVDFAFCGTMAK
jgi:D-amino-acid dehydrogenase